MRALKITGMSLLIILLLIILFVSYITMTHGGMQRLFSLGSSYMQGELHWSELQGSLIGPAEVDDLRFNADDGTSVRIDNIQLDWHPRSLIHRQVHVENFSASGIEIRLPKPVEPAGGERSEPFQLNDLRLPVGAEIKQLSLTDIRVYPYDSDTPIVIDRVVFGGNGQRSDLQVVELSASVPNGAVKVDGVVNTTGSWPVSLTAAWQYEDEQLGPLEGRATASGDLDELAIVHELSGAIESTAELTISDVIGELSLSGVASVSADNLGVLSPAAENIPLTVEAKVSGHLNDIQVDADLASRHELSGPLAMHIVASTDQKVVQVKQIEVTFDEAPAVISGSGDVDLATQSVDLDLQWSQLTWPLQQEPLQQEPLVQDPLIISDSSGELSLQASAEGATIIGNGLVDQDQAGRMEIAVDVVADPKQVLVNSLTVGGAGTDTSLDVAGVFSIDDNRIDLEGDWQNLQWPLQGSSADFESRIGQFSVVGPLSDYQLDVSLDVGGSKVPEGNWIISGSGNESALSALQVTGDTLDGKLEAVGTAGWNPQPEWNLDISARGVNPESQWPGFDASINVDIKSSGIVTAEGLSQSTDIVDIGGIYKGQPLDGSGGVSVVDGALVVDNLSLVAGSANITASGTIGNEVDLQWQVEAPSLEELVPGFSGELQIAGEHMGSADSMASQVAVQSAQIDSEFLKINDLNGTATVDLSGRKNSVVEIRAADINVSGQQWDALSITGDGTPQSHKVDVSLSGPQGELKLQGDGAYADDVWNGTVTDLSALATDFGDWTLEQPVKVVAGAQQVRFRDLCMSSNASSLCAALTRLSDGTVAANAAMEDFDIELVREFLPLDIEIDVVIDGQVAVDIDKQGQIKAVANAGFPDGYIRYQERGIPVQRSLGQSEFTADFNDDKVDINADLNLMELGFIKLGAVLFELGSSDDAVTPRIKGTLDSEITDLAVVGAFAPELESVSGEFSSNLAFNGAIDSPRVTGSASVDELSLEVPSVALEVTDGALEVSGNGRGGLLLRGAARSGDGQLDLDGRYSASSGVLDLGVAGQNFLVSNTSRQLVEISPDLNIRFADRQLTVSGDLLVPTALIRAGGGTSLVTESPDVVIVDSSVVREEKKENDINLDVQVILGDDIRIDAGQFDGALSGGLRVNKKPGQVVTASGTIEVTNGDFLVYGQKLTMESGKILFSGGPIDDPALDLDVARDVAEYSVKAGVKVSGSAQTPILELQSDPPQTDANTLSFILLGKPVDALGASYTLGRFITPDIYVSFGFDLFDKRELFTLRYTLSDRLSLIGSSSRSREPSSGADLIYTLER